MRPIGVRVNTLSERRGVVQNIQFCWCVVPSSPSLSLLFYKFTLFSVVVVVVVVVVSVLEEQILTGLRWRVAFDDDNDDDDDDEAPVVVVRTEGAFILVVGIVIYTSVK